MRYLVFVIFLIGLNACASSGSSSKRAVPLLDPLTVDYRISQKFGPNKSPFTGKSSYHYGLDMAAKRGATIRAAAKGVVTRASFSNGYGNLVEIEHKGGLRTRYAHLDGVSVRKGQRVLTGQPIGTVGLTGRTTGPHLHFEVLQNGKQVDPYQSILLGQKQNLSVSPELQGPVPLVRGRPGI